MKKNVQMQIVNPNSAGIDVGSRSHYVAIGQEVGQVKEFSVYTSGHKEMPALKDYRFSIVFENAQYDKYYTEKVTDCFATGTVPVYWGTRRISEDFDARGIIFWEELDSIDKLTPERYEAMLPYVEENLIRVKQLRSADDQLFYNIQRFH